MQHGRSIGSLAIVNPFLVECTIVCRLAGFGRGRQGGVLRCALWPMRPETQMAMRIVWRYPSGRSIPCLTCPLLHSGNRQHQYAVDSHIRRSPYTVHHNTNGFINTMRCCFHGRIKCVCRDCLTPQQAREALRYNFQRQSSYIVKSILDWPLVQIDRASVISGKASGRKVTSEVLIRLYVMSPPH